MSSVCASAHVLMCAHSVAFVACTLPSGCRVCRMGERIFVPVSRRIESGNERSLPERKSESEQLSELVCWAVPKECIVRARTAPSKRDARSRCKDLRPIMLTVARRREQLASEKSDTDRDGHRNCAKSAHLAQRTTPSGCACQASRSPSGPLQFRSKMKQRAGVEQREHGDRWCGRPTRAVQP